MIYAGYREQLKKQLKLHEGVYSRAYRDPFGIPTVGVGFNLLRADAPLKLSLIGADYNKVLNGEEELTPSQIEKLLDMCIDEAEEGAKRLVPDFDSLDPVRKRVVVDLVFNLGEGKLSTFTKFLKYVNEKRFDKASLQLARSLWFRQTGYRAIRLTAMLLTGKDLID